MAAQGDELAVGIDVHVGLHHVEQHLLLGAKQVLLAGIDARFCRLRAVDGAEAAEQRLVQLDGHVAGRGVIDGERVHHGAVRRKDGHAFFGRARAVHIRRHSDRRPPA